MSRQISELGPNQVFVFGSNLAGRHGKGAALFARKWGAKNGKGEGHHGKTYGIPTKDARIRTLPLRDIAEHVNTFLQYATEHPELEFLVTEIGCGLAGYSTRDIGPMFRRKPLPNIILPDRFVV